MIHVEKINGILLKTGDLICTTDGSNESIMGQYWRFIGKMIPGEVDHIVVYVGPDGKCIESGPNGVIEFQVESGLWNSEEMKESRGGLIDTFYGVAFPLKGRKMDKFSEMEIREGVAWFCTGQVVAERPYNMNFFNSTDHHQFYCSQLPYVAYLPYEIDLNTGIGIPKIPFTESIIFPQEIWEGLPNEKA